MLLLEHSAIGTKRLCSTNNKLFVSIKSNWECLLLGPGMKANKKISFKNTYFLLLKETYIFLAEQLPWWEICKYIIYGSF